MFHEAALNAAPLPEASLDFAYSIGVLHHLPDPQAGLAACVQKLKPRAPMLIYIYYAFDNRPAWFRLLWRVSDLVRRALSKMPFRLKSLVTDLIAALVYWPLARTARIGERLGRNVDHGRSAPIAGGAFTACAPMRSIALARDWSTV